MDVKSQLVCGCDASSHDKGAGEREKMMSEVVAAMLELPTWLY